MNAYTFAIHDLNNKLMNLYCLIRKYKQGNPPPCEKVDANIERINELVKSLYKDFHLESIGQKPFEIFNQDELYAFINSKSQKLSNLFDDVGIKINTPTHQWENNASIEIDKGLLYQALENAVENSQKAKATEIQINLVLKDQHLIVEMTDNGEGFKESEKIDRLLPHATGVMIIKENMRAMGAKAEYETNSSSGVTLKFIFPLKT